MPIHFRLNGQAFQLPAAWSELTAAQVLAVAPWAYVDPSGAARFHVLRALLPAKAVRFLRKLTPGQLFELSECLIWLWQKPLEEGAVSEFVQHGVRYLLPREKLLDASALEYAIACVHFAAFARPKPVPGSLLQLVATLCRPERAGYDPQDPAQDGKRRESYSADLAERRVKLFTDLPVPLQIVVLERFIAAQRFIHAHYSKVFTKPEPVKGGQRPEPPSDGSGMLQLLHALAQEGAYGTYDQVAQVPIHTILYNLHQAKRREEEAEG